MNLPDSHSSAAPAASKPLLYIVDDEPMLLELARTILQPHGYAIREFRDPQLALAAFAAEVPRPVLVVTDYAMQGMTGLKLMERLRQLEPGQKVLMVSGTVDEPFFSQCPMKPDRFLAKPYLNQDLIDMVRKLTDS